MTRKTYCNKVKKVKRKIIKIKKTLRQKKTVTGIKLARKMKREGYTDSEIVQETGYHI